jgi:opacity protein-like surface antigen
MGNEERITYNGKRRTENEERKMENGKWKMELRIASNEPLQSKIQNPKSKIAFVCLVMLFLSAPLQAKELGGQAGSAFRIGMGADRLAMGDVGTALKGSEMGWYYNPASLPFQKTRQTSIGYRMMSLDRSMFYADFSAPLKGNAGVSMGVVRASTGEIDARDSNGRRFDLLDYSDMMIHGTFGLRPHPRVGLGVSLKWLVSTASDVLPDNKNLNAYGMGVDIGVQIEPFENTRIGLQIRDIDAKVSWDASDVWADGHGAKDDVLPSLIRLGAAYEPRDDLSLAVDAVVNSGEVGNSSDAIALHFGGEWVLRESENRAFFLRGGWNGESPAFGLGFDLKLRRNMAARLDYAYVMDDVTPAGSHLFGWTFGF